MITFLVSLLQFLHTNLIAVAQLTHELHMFPHTFRNYDEFRENSNYQQIQSLAADQHEIATETISLQQGLQDKGYEEWVGEMIGMREILRHFANVSSNDVVGMRAPYLKPGRNAQYKVGFHAQKHTYSSRK